MVNNINIMSSRRLNSTSIFDLKENSLSDEIKHFSNFNESLKKELEPMKSNIQKLSLYIKSVEDNYKQIAISVLDNTTSNLARRIARKTKLFLNRRVIKKFISTSEPFSIPNNDNLTKAGSEFENFVLECNRILLGHGLSIRWFTDIKKGSFYIRGLDLQCIDKNCSDFMLKFFITLKEELDIEGMKPRQIENLYAVTLFNEKLWLSRLKLANNRKCKETAKRKAPSNTVAPMEADHSAINNSYSYTNSSSDGSTKKIKYSKDSSNDSGSDFKSKANNFQEN